MAVRKVKGSWWVDFMYNGERLRKPSPHNSKASAQEFEVYLRQQVAQHGTVEKALEATKPKKTEATPTFSEFAERWLRDYAEVNNSLSEQRNKRSAIRLYLSPAFGRLRLNHITTEEVEHLKAKLLAAGLRAKTVNNALGILRKCMSTAVDWNYITQAPRIRALKAPPPAFRFLSENETERLVASAPSGMWRAMILTAVRTGLRFSELSGLMWCDVDLESRRLCVRQARVLRHLGTTKNNRIRYVGMTSDVVAALRGIVRQEGYVFTREDRPIEYHTAAWILKIACRTAGLSRIGWHTLRHSFASHLAMRSAPLSAIKDLLGHSTINMTLRYAHLSPDVLRDAIRLLDPQI